MGPIKTVRCDPVCGWGRFIRYDHHDRICLAPATHHIELDGYPRGAAAGVKPIEHMHVDLCAEHTAGLRSDRVVEWR